MDGSPLQAARQQKRATYPELTGCCIRVVKLGARALTSLPTSCKPKGEPPVLCGRAQQAWALQWSPILACISAQALALSLLERQETLSSDGITPTTSEVIGRVEAHRPVCVGVVVLARRVLWSKSVASTWTSIVNVRYSRTR